ncbi:hypothetical protein NQ317_008946 [Molorchus minor]|uniref:Gem-associated protein 2 n=1 Tax=Molorchus minor TaxID=1323400 RepID=A0ABQ9K0L2_9CUCU|nr:hypothetical protein NQ317_008946 [Molorchus minor]
MCDSDSSDGEYDGILKRALEVKMPDNFDPNSIPQNGNEYLHHVIYERSRCQKCVTVDIDRSKFKNKQTFRVQEEPIMKPPPRNFLPTSEWQIEKIKDFTDFRQYVHSQILEGSNITSFDDDNFIEKAKNETPIFSEITQFSQSCKITMLRIITNYLDSLQPGESIENKLGTWIYAILTLLETPLSPDYCYSLRELARKCSNIRSNLPENTEESLYVPLNLYICIIAIYFNQLDLSD